MTVRLNILAGGALAFSVLAFGSPSPGAEPRVHEIEIDKLAFGPAPKVLHVNDIVEWVNADIFLRPPRTGASTPISRLAPRAGRL
jgi:hypothetical protein